MFSAKAIPNGHYVDFLIYEMSGLAEDDNGNYTVPIYQLPDDKHHDTESLDNAKVFLHGTVKWDGCSDWMVDEMARHHMLHSCDRKYLENFGQIMTRCWDWTKELIPDTWHH